MAYSPTFAISLPNYILPSSNITFDFHRNVHTVLHHYSIPLVPWLNFLKYTVSTIWGRDSKRYGNTANS